MNLGDFQNLQDYKPRQYVCELLGFCVGWSVLTLGFQAISIKRRRFLLNAALTRISAQRAIAIIVNHVNALRRRGKNELLARY